MESKSVKNSNIFLFGLSFNLILTLGSLSLTCYSLHRLESHVTAVEQDLLVLNHPYRLDNHEIIKPSSTHSPLSDSEGMKENLVKRAVDGSSLCRKCNRVCLNSNGPRKVRRFYVQLPFRVQEKAELVVLIQLLRSIVQYIHFF